MENGFGGGEAPPSDNLYVSELPPDTTEETLRQIFGPNVTQCKVLPERFPGSTRVALVRFSSLSEASHVRVLLNGAIPPGCSTPVCIRFCGKLGDGQGGKGGSSGSSGMHRSEPYPAAQAGALFSQQAQAAAQMWPELAQPGAAPPSDNLHITGLPLGLDNETLKAMFSQYGTVAQCKVLDMKPDATSSHALVRYSTLDEAVLVKQSLSGYTMQGLSEPVVVTYAIQKKWAKTGEAGSQGWNSTEKVWGANTGEQGPPAEKWAKTGEICTWFLKGECWNGDRCSKIHSSG